MTDEPWLQDILDRMCADYAEITVSADIPVREWDTYGIDVNEMYGKHRWGAAIYSCGRGEVYGAGATREEAAHNAARGMNP